MSSTATLYRSNGQPFSPRSRRGSPTIVFRSKSTAETPKVYTAGHSFVDPGGGHVHMLRKETDAAAQTVAVSIVPKDALRRIDRPAAGNCRF